jgi:acetolactate synthase I/II/III large subunit
MNVAEAVARALFAHGVDHVFGVVGSGNFHVTNALIAAGARFVAAAHEGGSASMADGFARVSGKLCALSVHQGPGFTNAITGITEAAKSRTPLVVLAPEATNPRSNFFVDLAAIAKAVGAEFRRVDPEHAPGIAALACETAVAGAGRTVILGLPLEAQALPAGAGLDATVAARPDEREPDVSNLVDALRRARRPVFVAGRGATRRPVEAREALAALAARCGALITVSAAAKGLFAGDPWYLDVSGGFATPLAAELISQADLIVAWGSTLNMWTTRHGRLIPKGATVAQIDLDPASLGVNRTVDVAVAGDIVAVARSCLRDLRASSTGWRTPDLRARIAAEGTWRRVRYEDEGGPDRIDPRTLTIALDDLLPATRTVAIDSGNFMGYPSMFLSVPDVHGFVFTQAFQSIGLGLASALGAALARPDRLTVAALGDGGFAMSVAELTTATRLALPLLVIIYDDAAYGAEVHHFGPDGYPLDTVRFPETDLAAIARGFGCEGATVRSRRDLQPVSRWLAGPRDRPLVVDAKIVSAHGSWWLEEAFRGH